MKVGQLSAFRSAGSLYVDWRMTQPGRRWRLVVGRRRWVPFSERYGYADRPRARRILGVDVAWYGRGVE